MHLDRLLRDEQRLGDVAVGHPVRRHPRHPLLGRRQRRDGFRLGALRRPGRRPRVGAAAHARARGPRRAARAPLRRRARAPWSISARACSSAPSERSSTATASASSVSPSSPPATSPAARSATPERARRAERACELDLLEGQPPRRAGVPEPRRDQRGGRAPGRDRRVARAPLELAPAGRPAAPGSPPRARRGGPAGRRGCASRGCTGGCPRPARARSGRRTPRASASTVPWSSAV